MNSRVSKVVILLCASQLFIASKCVRKQPSPVVGGPCHYAKYPGTITVTNVEFQKPSSTGGNQGGTDPQWVTVTVEFKGEDSGPAAHLITDIQLTALEAREKEVKKGKQFHAYSMYQTRGTCNPGPYLAAFSEWQ
jgi:hypothetical protein